MLISVLDDIASDNYVLNLIKVFVINIFCMQSWMRMLTLLCVFKRRRMFLLLFAIEF